MSGFSLFEVAEDKTKSPSESLSANLEVIVFVAETDSLDILLAPNRQLGLPATQTNLPRANLEMIAMLKGSC